MIRRPLWPFFPPSFSYSGPWRAPLPGVLLSCSMYQAHRGVPLARVLLCRSAHQSLKGAPWVGSRSAVQCVRHLMGQALYCSATNAGVRGERGYGDGFTPYMWLSSIALLPWLPCFLPSAFPTTIHPLPNPLSICLSTINNSPRPGIAPQSPTPGPSHYAFQGTHIPVQGIYGCSKECLILIPFRLPQISCFTLSLKCFSSDSDNCPIVGTGLLLQFSLPPRAGPVLLTLLFFPLVPSSYRVLHDSIYSFPLVRYSCLLSTGILHALLCLKVYSWCIHGERCTPRPPTPLPSCSLFLIF